MRTRRAVVVVVVALLCGAGSLAAPTQAKRAATVLRSSPGIVGWGGQVAMGATEQLPLTVDLGPRFWGGVPGAVEVTIRWVYDAAITDLDLTVRDVAGNVLARSAGLDSNAESVFLPSLP